MGNIVALHQCPQRIYLGTADDFINFRPGYLFHFLSGIYPKIHLQKPLPLSVRKDGGEGTVSSFGSLAVMIGATVGTGSILGVTTAVAEGGPRGPYSGWRPPAYLILPSNTANVRPPSNTASGATGNMWAAPCM